MDGKKVTKEEIDLWELKRLKKEYRFLKRRGFKFSEKFKSSLEERNIDEARKELALLKTTYSPNVFRKLLRKKYILGNFASRIAVSLTTKRKYSIVDIVIPYSSKSPEEVMDSIKKIMLQNTKQHLYINLSTTPDHFVLVSTAENIQEVLEVTGGSPLPNHFFAHYGDEKGLTSVLSEGFTVQAPGTARLKDGTIIGGVRHQIKKEFNGLRFRALVEFPSLVPNYMIKKHQYHLACEFRQWLSYSS